MGDVHDILMGGLAHTLPPSSSSSPPPAVTTTTTTTHRPTKQPQTKVTGRTLASTVAAAARKSRNVSNREVLALTGGGTGGGDGGNTSDDSAPGGTGGTAANGTTKQDSGAPPPGCMVFTTTQGRKLIVDPKKHTRKWMWGDFTNSARGDDTKLKHWKRDEIVLDEYAFARFNKAAYVVRLPAQAWDRICADPVVNNATWSRGETEVLFDLCLAFDLRWAIIADRFRFHIRQRGEGIAVKDIVDLKERYYSICRLLLNEPGLIDPSPPAPLCFPRVIDPSPKLVATVQTSLRSFTFDRVNEAIKMHQLDRQFHQSKQEEEEETKLGMELQRVEMEIRKLQRESKQQSTSGGGGTSGGGHNTGKKQKRAPKRHDRDVVEMDDVISDHGDFTENVLEAMETSHKDEQQHGHDLPIVLKSYRIDPGGIAAAVGGVSEDEVQRQGTPLVMSEDANIKLGQVLQLLGVPEDVVPTDEVCDAYLELKRNVVRMLVLWKNVKQKYRQLGLPPPKMEVPTSFAVDQGVVDDVLTRTTKSMGKRPTATTTTMNHGNSGSSSGKRRKM